MISDKVLAIIETAIAEYQGDTGPGQWIATTWYERGEKPALVYEYDTNSKNKNDSWPLPGPEWKSADDPWKRWGGDEIVALIEKSSKLWCCSGGLECDCGVYQDAAIFRIEEEEEEESD